MDIATDMKTPQYNIVIVQPPNIQITTVIMSLMEEELHNNHQAVQFAALTYSIWRSLKHVIKLVSPSALIVVDI